jgi:SAM-dependent methyltransferase
MQGQDMVPYGTQRASALAPLYDAALALLAREGRWRAALTAQVAPEAHDVILDGFCGAGALSFALARANPGAEIVGLDPRPAVIAQARARAAETGVRVSFVEGAPRDAALYLGVRMPTQVVLTLTGAPGAVDRLAELQGARAIMDPAGLLHVIDHGRARSPLMRLAAASRRVDPVETATMIRAAGFVAVEETAAWSTPAGPIALFRARAT